MDPVHLPALDLFVSAFSELRLIVALEAQRYVIQMDLCDYLSVRERSAWMLEDPRAILEVFLL